jgi:hypothetical protein
LSANTTYYATIKAGASAAFALRTITVDAANDMTAYPGGTSFFYVTRNDDSGAPASPDSNLTRTLIDLYIDDCTGGGGTVVRRGVIGG